MKSKAAIQTVLDKDLIIDELDIPDPLPHQVIVKLYSSGICHSQLHQMEDPELDRPFVPGHEATGVVTHIGRDVRHVKENDHAIITWVPRIPIKGREPNIPSGVTYRKKIINEVKIHTWAQDVLVDSKYVIPITKEHPTDVSSIVGCAVLTGAGAVLNTAKVRPGNSVAIIGVGGVGLSAVQMASILEANPIIVVDLLDEKLEFAKEFGATHLVNASVTDPVKAIVEISGGGVDYAFDAIGVRASTEQILPATRGGGPGADNHGGMAILIGYPGREMTLNPQLFMFHQRRFRGSLGATYPEKDFQMFLRWYQEGKFPLDRLVTQRYKLEQINEACAALKAGEILGRSIIEF